jgi:hypothetical protein
MDDDNAPQFCDETGEALNEAAKQLVLDALTADKQALNSNGGAARPLGRGLHSFASQLNLSAVYGIGGARRGCVAPVKGVFRVCLWFSCDRYGSS